MTKMFGERVASKMHVKGECESLERWENREIKELVHCVAK